MTISIDQAKSLAAATVSALGKKNNDELALIESSTVEVDGGWVFFYNTQEFVDTGNPISRLAGNGPIFVNRYGYVKELPSAIPWETAIKSI